MKYVIKDQNLNDTYKKIHIRVHILITVLNNVIDYPINYINSILNNIRKKENLFRSEKSFLDQVKGQYVEKGLL